MRASGVWIHHQPRQRLRLGSSSFSHYHHVPCPSPQLVRNHGHPSIGAPPLSRGMCALYGHIDEGKFGEGGEGGKHEGGPMKWEAHAVRHKNRPSLSPTDHPFSKCQHVNHAKTSASGRRLGGPNNSTKRPTTTPTTPRKAQRPRIRLDKAA